MYAKKNNNKKILPLLLALVMLIGCAIGGTLAWLVTETGPVTNTFTVGNITLELTETWNTKSDGAATEDIWQGKMVPGTTLEKDPHVIVKGSSEDCWLFVRVEESCSVPDQSFADFVSYTVGAVWSEVESGADYTVYAWKEVVNSNTEDQTFYVLEGDTTYTNGCVTIPQTVTKNMMDKVTTGNAPKLTFTAYAIQSENLKKDGAEVTTAADAWYVYNNPPQNPDSNN